MASYSPHRLVVWTGSLLALSSLVGCGAPQKAPDRARREAAAADRPLEPNVDPTVLRLELVDRMVAAGSYEPAVPIVRRVLAENPKEGLAHHYLGVILAGRGQLVQAERELKEALKLRPGLAATLDQLGMLYGRQRRFEEALRYHRQAVQAAPESPAYHHNLGYTLFLSGQTEDAVEELRAAIALDPSARISYTSLGFALGKLGRFDEARRAFVQGGGEAVAEANLGLAHELRGELDEARAAYERALELHPGYPMAQENLRALERGEGLGTPGTPEPEPVSEPLPEPMEAASPAASSPDDPGSKETAR